MDRWTELSLNTAQANVANGQPIRATEPLGDWTLTASHDGNFVREQRKVQPHDTYASTDEGLDIKPNSSSMNADLLTDTRAELDILMGTSISGLVEPGLTKILLFAFSARVYNVLVRRRAG